MSEKLKVSYGRCVKCGAIAEYYFNDIDDTEEPCERCHTKGEIYKVIVWKA